MARVLVACESSGAVRRAFRALGHDAWSCDLLPADDGSEFHYQCDIREVLGLGWDLLIGFPPCTDLCVSGARYWAAKAADGRQEAALDLVRLLMNAPIARIAIENPVGLISTRIRKPDQIIQPHMFNHPESKKTCLWLKNLPKLVPTGILPLPPSGRWANQTPSGQNKLGPSKDRWKLRSATYEGVALGMASQWGPLL